MTRSSSLLVTQAHAALELSRAPTGAVTRAELEHLISDVAAETLLLEVERLRIARALETAGGPRIQPVDVTALAERRTQLEAELEELRAMAERIRSRLRGRA